MGYIFVIDDLHLFMSVYFAGIVLDLWPCVKFICGPLTKKYLCTRDLMVWVLDGVSIV